MTITVYVFPKLRTVENEIGKMSERFYFRTPFNSQHAKGSQTLLKFYDRTFILFFPHYDVNGVEKWLS